VGGCDDERDLGDSASRLKSFEGTLVRSSTALELDHISPSTWRLTLIFLVLSNLCLKELIYHIAKIKSLLSKPQKADLLLL
jgi:hypothetical protein